MPTFKLTLAYDGTGLVGWQQQASGTSIQGLLEGALRALDGREVSATAAGRTDAGVHALGQVVSITIERTIDARSLVRALNARLPDAVRVLDAAAVAPTFHARFDARSKTYRYRIWNAEVISPFERAYAWHVPAPPLDVDAMAAAATLLNGRHDFSTFQAAGTETRDAERTVFSSCVRGGAGPSAPVAGVWPSRSTDRGEHDSHPLITYEICGDGFLRHMVRNIVGTLIEVGRGRRPVAWVSEVMASRDRGLAGATAPGEGLFLVGVRYDTPLADER